MSKKNTNENINDEFFFLKKDTYKEDFLPYYIHGKINPKKIFQTSVMLPFQIPVKTGTCVTMMISDNIAFTLVLGQLNTTNKFRAGILRDVPVESETSRTVAELILVTNDGSFHKDENDEKFDFLSYLFDFCLEKLNFFISSYLITTKDTSVHRVTIKMFEIASMFRFIEPSEWKYTKGLFLLHGNVPYLKPELTQEETQKVIWYASVINQKWNPFIMPEELMLNAKRNFNDGFHKEAIIHSQTAFETFLRTLLTEFYKEENKSIEELNQVYNDFGFMGVLKREFHQRIGGQWNVTNDNTDLGIWYRDCYTMRNRIIHSGYDPNFDEVSLAIGSVDNMISKILERVESKKKKFPKVFKYIVKK